MTTFTVAIAILASMIACTSGYKSYNSTTELCCNGTVFPKETDDGCCGKQSYAYNKFLCCNEQLFPVDENSNLTCCIDYLTGRTELYDYYTQTCCAGKAIDIPDKEGASYTCCNDKLYDYNTQVCCGDTVEENDDGKKCCIDEMYDVTSKVCCLEWDATNSKMNHNFIDLVGSASECCNGVAYDPNENICCNDAILALPKGLEDKDDAYCCGEDAYDSKKKVCCYERVNDDENSETETKYLYNLVEIVGERDTCCGHDVYDTETEICCDSTTSEVSKLPEDIEEDGYYKCCGKGPVYNARNQVCVGDNLVNQTGNLDVCGDVLIDYNTQSCCKDTIYDFNSPMRCNYNTMELYNGDEKMWCEGEKELVDISDEDKSLGNDACCSVVYY